VVYRRKDRPREGYRVWITLPKPWGLVGPWQTGLKDKKQARAVESWLIEMSVSRPEIIDCLTAIPPVFSLRDVWIAKQRGTLDALLLGINDPLLTDAVEAYRPHCKDGRAASGLDQIKEYAPAGARLSWLAGNNIRDLYAKAAVYRRKKDPEGKVRTRAPNSIRRSLYRAICELLAYHLTEAGRVAAMKEVPAPGEDDTREVHARADEVAALLDACTPLLKWYVVAAIATAIDRGVLLRMTPRHIRDEMLAVPDRKTKDRTRLVRVSGIAMVAFRMAAMGKGMDERLWPLTIGEARHAYDKTRAKAGVPGLRFKDLRHILPTLMAELGADRREIQAYIGHAMGSKQTDRYITPTGDVGILDAAAEKLGLTKANMRVG
jgi:integrase